MLIEIINLFVKNDGMYTHLFCPQQGICEICGETQQSHSYVFDERYESLLQRVDIENLELEEIEDLVPKRLETIQCAICDGQFYRSDIATIEGKAHDICNECFGIYLR